jgi:hypothetical protein
MVCDKALLAAYVAGTKHISLDIVEKSITELEGAVTV